MTFVRGTDERAVLTGLGVDPEAAIAASRTGVLVDTGNHVIRSDEWLVALEESCLARGESGPEVLRSLSAGTEIVAITRTSARATTSSRTRPTARSSRRSPRSAPPSWGGTQPDRLRRLAEELGMQRTTAAPPTPT